MLTPAVSITQLDERESVPVDSWLRDNALQFRTSASHSSSSVANSEVQTLSPDFQHASTLTDVRRCSDAATDTVQLEDDCAAVAARAAVEAQERARLEEQQMLLRSQFDAEVSGYQMQLSQVERTKDTQLCVQSNVIVAMLDMLQLPEDFPPFPDSNDEFNSHMRSQLQLFLAAFQAHTQLKNAELSDLQQGNVALRGELIDLRMQLQQLRLQQQEAARLQQQEAASSQHSHSGHSHASFYADATSEESSPITPQELLDRRTAEHARLSAEMQQRVEEQKRFSAELEDMLREARADEDNTRVERDEARQQVVMLQQQMQAIMQVLRGAASPPRHANAAPDAHRAAAHPVHPPGPAQQQQPYAAEHLSPRHMYHPPPLPRVPTHLSLTPPSPPPLLVFVQ